MPGNQRPVPISTKQARIAELARQMPGTAITSLSHRMDQAWLKEAFRRTRKDGAVGVDGVSAEDYSKDLEDNLQALENRAKSGTYRAPPVRRVHIPKGDGRKTRPIGIPTFEDKVLQRAVAMALEPIYEQDFYDFSYGFRPNRSAHDALEAVDDALHNVGSGWVLDVDIQSFFDTLDHQKLRDLFRQRVTDGVITRLVGKWLRAGVLEGGVVSRSDRGTPQGGVISPLLANIYLHEVLDRWWVEEVRPRLRGRAFIIRYADDFVVVFSAQADAKQVQEALPERFGRFGLTLHPDKTRLVRFRPPGKGPKTGSFDFLGFTHYWGRSRKGRWIKKRKTASSRLSRALRRINQWMRKCRHLPMRVQARILGQKLRGHYQYYGIRYNSRGIGRFHYEVVKRWCYWLRRRSQRAYRTLNWETYLRLLKTRYPLPPPRLPRRSRQLRLAFM